MTLTIMDPNLKTINGHHLEWDLAIGQASLPVFRNCHIFGHKAVAIDDVGPFGVTPLFTHVGYESVHADPVMGHFDDFNLLNTTLFRDLETIDKDRFSPSDAVLVPTLTERHLLGYVSWMKTFSPERAPTFVVHLMFPPGLERRGDVYAIRQPLVALFYKLGFRKSLEAGPPIHFFGGGRQVAREYSALFGTEVPPHPVPFRPRRTRPAGTGRPTCLLYAGEARLDKGFALVPDLAQVLCSAYPGWDFLIHADRNPHERAIDLRSLGPLSHLRNLRVTVGHLSRRDYLAELETADCMVFTYHPAAYASRSSGLLWEAVSLGMPVLVPDGTWLAREADAWAAGRVTYAGHDVASMRDGFARLASDLPRLLELAGRSADAFFAENGAEAVVRQIHGLMARR